MPIRPASRQDIPAMAQVCAAAFQDDELFGDLLNPYREQYPADFVAYWERKIWRKWFDYHRILMVSVDEGSTRVVGVADWERMGKGAKMRGKGEWWDLRRLSAPAAEFTTRITEWWSPLRCTDPTKSTVLDDSHAICGHHWEGPRTENWYLDILAVHPDFQGEGHGKALVLKGLEEVRKESIPASLIASLGKDGFYAQFGFREVGRANVGPLKGIKGGAIMFTEV